MLERPWRPSLRVPEVKNHGSPIWQLPATLKNESGFKGLGPVQLAPQPRQATQWEKINHPVPVLPVLPPVPHFTLFSPQVPTNGPSRATGLRLMSACSLPLRPLKGHLCGPKYFKGVIYLISSIIHACLEGTGRLLTCKQRYSIFLASIDMHSYSSNTSNVPHTNIHYDPLSLSNPSQQSQRDSSSQHIGTLEAPYFGPLQHTYPFPAHKISLGYPQRGTSLPKSSLGPHPHSQELIRLDLLYPPFPANTSLGPPAEDATTSRRREPVDESERQVTNRPPR